ncbi:YbaK/aminoacyl-tRNA synthetase-associated domain [Macleaya cordata]|uniref:YbaK/aminoacyl-tRNA synthetase-associated domain n=1 Tax=Macleaya cordata TaxID=56857 RepID=A0A200QJ10_MACCD|nr:YbaK/aminoacyl-tRNA synthetase-associated domain [Macleaya cordata]
MPPTPLHFRPSWCHIQITINHGDQFDIRVLFPVLERLPLTDLQGFNICELQINFVRYDHPVVLTVEAQAKYVGHLGGGLSKNLFLKDKKQRFYIVSALAGTTVDLKVLSQRLGLGKGGVRMAPEEALQEILQVPLGCVTPFALINDSARNVSLLLDQGFKSQEYCYFHPLSNDITISLSARDLDKFLISIGKDPSYVDLEANPSVGKDQPPDLAGLVPSGTTVLADQPEKIVSIKPPSANDVPPENKSNAVAGKATKQSNNVEVVKEKSQSAAHPLSSGADIRKFVEEIIDKTSALVLSEITKESTLQQGEQLASVVSSAVRKRLSLDLESLAWP